ncbi:MAG: tRNA 2-selenouridine(34) synthase MnmH [Ignavibacteria bacterium]|nr:tRNA 2-selenouridine(34) synthase MnmH [Ignavibacteria bacterium]
MMTTVFDDLFSDTYAVIDVRSPAEYAAGHIPGAINIPIFSNEERAVVGTAYVQDGREQAVDIGLQIVGPKLAHFVSQARAIGKPLIVYCWRGGMRSSSMGWLFTTAGLSVRVVPRGYKGFRAWGMGIISRPWKLHVVGGRTGSGKTHHLHQLAVRGEQILDLEGLANHKGSSFGALGEQPQPTTEHFMNLMTKELHRCSTERTLWVEDESRNIGTVVIPDVFYDAMQIAPIDVLDVSSEQRVTNLVADYGHASPEGLIAAFERIRRKLGGERCTQAIEAVKAGDIATAAEIALEYYDRTYDYCLKQRTANSE